MKLYGFLLLVFSGLLVWQSCALTTTRKEVATLQQEINHLEALQPILTTELPTCNGPDPCLMRMYSNGAWVKVYTTGKFEGPCQPPKEGKK